MKDMKELTASNVWFLQQALPGKTSAERWQALAGWLGNLPEAGGIAFNLPTAMLDDEEGQEERARIVRAHVIAAVISMPHRRMDVTQNMREELRRLEDRSIVIFAKDAPRIRMAAIDHMEAYRKRGFVELPNEQMMELLQQEGTYVFDVTPEAVVDAGASLRPASYVVRETSGGRREPLGAVATITRGAIVVREKFEESETPTMFRRLSLRTILSPVEELPSLKSIPEDFQQFCVQPGDIVLSRIVPYRLRLVEELAGQQILADGNLILLRANPDVLLPTVLYLYLKSEEGQELITTHGSGLAHAVNLRQMAKLPVPVPPMETQQAIAERYGALQQQLADVERQAAALRAEIDGLITNML